MNADQLLKLFNLLGDAPETIQQLRKLVIALAISGKLSTQGEIKDVVDRSSFMKPLEGVAQPEVLADDLPKGFVNAAKFVRLGSVARIEKGKTGILKAKPGAYPLVVTAEERSTSDHFDFDGAAAIVPLVSSAGHGKASLQRLHYQEGRFALGSILAAIFPLEPTLISARFLFEYLTAFKDELLVSRMIGTANVSLSIGKVSEVPVPLVLPAIQRKVDELMATCDRLELARAEREARRDRLATASLARLNAPNSDAAIFAKDARFSLNNLSAIAARPDQIKQLRQTILNLAMSGRLSDEGRWAPSQTRLGEIASLQNGYAFKSEWFSTSGTRLLRNTNVSHGILNWSDEVRLPEALISEYERFRLREGDVVLSLDRPFIVTGTKVARIRAGDLPALLLQRVGRFILPDALDPEYLFRWINSPLFSEQIDPGRSNGVPHISSKQVEAARLFVPPLAEQRRIVAKVDELMALCDRLDASLIAGADTRRGFLEALLAESLMRTAERDKAA